MPLVNLEKQLVRERFEWRGPQPIRQDIVILSIDDISKELDPAMFSDEEKRVRALELMTSFPFPREVYAHIADRLLGAGAKVVAFDILYPSPSIYGVEDDTHFAQALQKYRDHVVIGSNIQNPKNPRVTGDGLVNGISMPVSTLLDERPEDYVGFVNYFPHVDGTIRYAMQEVSLEILDDPLHVNRVEDWHSKLLSWDALIVKKADPQIPLRPYHDQGMINYQGAVNTYKNYSIHRIFSDNEWKYNFYDNLVFTLEDILTPFTWKQENLLGEGFGNNPLYDVYKKNLPPYPAYWSHKFNAVNLFKNKIVLIGPMGNWTHDYHDTPFGVMSGVEIHAHSIATILNGNYLRETYRWWVNALMILLPVMAVALSVQFARNIWLSAGFFVLVTVVLFGLGQYLFVAHLLIIPMAWVLTGIIFMEVVGLVYKITIEAIERNRIRSTFDRFVSKNVASYILKNRKEYEQSLGGVRKPVTVLFSDIRGFTTMTESADAGALVEQLNEYFSKMVPCVFNYGGTLHKFIGDAVMAVWGDTHSQGVKEDALDAVRAICAMTEELRGLNRKWKDSGKAELKIGVGLNHGDVVVGYIGSPERMEFTVIGDAVNLGSRLEGATKEFKTDKLIGESVAQFVRDEFWLQSAGSITVKGKTKPVRVFIPICEKGKEPPDFDAEWLQRYEEAYAQYLKKQFAQAKALFARCLEDDPDSFLAGEYAEGCEYLIANPPDESWDGTKIMKTK